MAREIGGEQSLAPVIPLFGDAAFSRRSVSRDDDLFGEDRGEACAKLSAGAWHSTWVDDDDLSEDDDDPYFATRTGNRARRQPSPVLRSIA